MILKKLIITLFLMILTSAGFTQNRQNWPHWRGPDHNGISILSGRPNYRGGVRLHRSSGVIKFLSYHHQHPVIKIRKEQHVIPVVPN